MDSKPWWASRTVWVNAVAGVGSLATAFGLDLPLDAGQQAALVGGIMAAINILLRLITTKPVTARRNKP